jgi:hypothetical protein
MAKQKQKTSGPAKSASSMMCASGVRRGLRTVKLLSLICSKEMPSSAPRPVRRMKRKGKEPLHLRATVARPDSHWE